MSLRKFFTGKPGNIQEFVDAISERSPRESKVDVLIESWTEQLQTGDVAFRGRIIYYYRTKEDVISGRSIKLLQRDRSIGGEALFPEGWTREEYKNELAKQVKPNVEYLSRRGINPTIKFLDYV